MWIRGEVFPILEEKMKFYVTFEVYASTTVEVEADTKEEAEELAKDVVYTPSLCHHCSRHLDIGDVGEILMSGEVE